MSEDRIAYLRPEQIRQRLSAAPVIYLPVGPLEWHGPHLPFGMDPLNAENVALGCCQETGGLVWPTFFWGTERERRPQQAGFLGFARDSYIVGMDFPANSLPSAYCPEEIFALLVRETLREIRSVGAMLAVIVNGHGALNQIATLQRLTIEFNNTTDMRVHFRIAVPQAEIDRGEGGHATALETSIMMSLHPSCVDVSTLPPLPTPLRYEQFAIVDGLGFDGKGAPGRVVLEDPRTEASADKGRDISRRTIGELSQEVQALLKDITTPDL